MDKIFAPLAKLFENPITEFFCAIGIPDGISKALSSTVIALLVWGAVAALKFLRQRFQDTKTATELVHFRYSYKDVKQKRDLFIPTQAQNNSPTYEEEPKQGSKFIVKEPLIPWLIHTAFNEKKESDKFYLILADSGMGKTTFMINLYLRYHSLRNIRRKYKMKLFPFSDTGIIKRIQEIKPDEARNTILLLDAFDEYRALLPPDKPDGLTDDERFHTVLDELIDNVKDFREVVITSRTQYFPGQEDKPYELKIPRGSGGFHTLAKLYLSPFEEKEIRRFLNKKYGVLRIWNHKKKQAAISIVQTSPKLMVRPMLLSYIDYLIDSQLRFTSTYQIYQTLVQKWIDREAEKRKHKSEDREKFKHDLNAFSRHAALAIFKNRNHESLLSKEEALEIRTTQNIDLRGYEITGQSLLTRDISHSWKFAHRSILEYFLAKEAVENFEFWSTLAKTNFAGFDMASLFYHEVGNWVYVEGGTYAMGGIGRESNSRQKLQHEVSISSFYIARTTVTQKQWNDIMGTNPSDSKNEDDHPVVSVCWHDVQKFLTKLSDDTGMSFRLPTEAEWEYAARGGIKSKGFKYAGSNNLDRVGWFHKNSTGNTHPVAMKLPNELGLYDMSGNVWEWCQDKWHDNYQDAPNDGSAWETGESSYRVLRGGSWYNDAEDCRSADRNVADPGIRSNGVGFRLVFVP